MKVFITKIPAFYKINLYNRISRKSKIFVIYTDTLSSDRNADFYDGKMEFEHIFLKCTGKISRSIELVKILFHLEYEEVIIEGWYQLCYWVVAFLSPKKKNAVAIESSVYDSKTSGIIGWIKRLFVSRISKAYVSGKLQKDLMDALDFKGVSIITKGVGIFNIVKMPPYERRNSVIKFLYVGRFSTEKNLFMLMQAFGSLPQVTLTMIGFGLLENELQEKAPQNVNIIGAVENKELYKYYQNHDVFILPSTSEVWGLVVEEAMNNGLPVIVSNKVGCAFEVVKDGENGLIFDVDNIDDLKSKILHITELDYYNMLRKNVYAIDFEEIARYQAEVYLK